MVRLFSARRPVSFFPRWAFRFRCLRPGAWNISLKSENPSRRPWALKVQSRQAHHNTESPSVSPAHEKKSAKKLSNRDAAKLWAEKNPSRSTKKQRKTEFWKSTSIQKSAPKCTRQFRKRELQNIRRFYSSGRPAISLPLLFNMLRLSFFRLHSRRKAPKSRVLQAKRERSKLQLALMGLICVQGAFMSTASLFLHFLPSLKRACDIFLSSVHQAPNSQTKQSTSV